MEETVKKQEAPAERLANVKSGEVKTRARPEPGYPKVEGMQPEDWESVASPRRRR